MKVKKQYALFAIVAAALVCVLNPFSATAKRASGQSLWAHDNLVAWCAVPFDRNHRGPEERAQMLQQLGFKHFAYDWREKDVPTFDAEIDALQKHGVELFAWWFPFDADDPLAPQTLEVFKRHNVHPQLWVMQSRKGPTGPDAPLEYTGEEQKQQVEREAQRISALEKLAAPYGSKVELYNHNGWFGKEENELAILARLKELGVTDVGLVYNFSHAHDAHHDDTADFPALWTKIQPHVVAVNVTGMGPYDQIIYPGQGSHELEMMRVIQKSGWHGPVGLIAEKGGDAEVTLKNYITGLDWLSAEIKKPGSGGPLAFPVVR